MHCGAAAHNVNILIISEHIVGKPALLKGRYTVRNTGCNGIFEGGGLFMYLL